jgi:adenine-specific DNA-methyltransferase
MGYDTQKPEGLLERIVGWATKPGDLVADFFCGSGTTLAVAERMGRRWIGSDAGEAAIDITRRRLLDQPEVTPFEVRSVMRAERRLWIERLEPNGAERAAAAAVLEAYGAEVVVGRFGRTAEHWVWVGSALRSTSEQDVEEACQQAADRDAKALVALAWEWASHDAAALKTRMHKRHGVTLTLRTIPAELMRVRNNKAPLRFAERAEADLELVPSEQAQRLSVRLTGVRCPDPPKLRANAKHLPERWSELVASWSVDWCVGEDGFAPSWRSEPVRNGHEICLQSPAHDFGQQPISMVQVKVVTIYGDEIVRTLRVES